MTLPLRELQYPERPSSQKGVGSGEATEIVAMHGAQVPYDSI